MRTVAITGGYGYVGVHLTQIFVQSGWQVVATTRRASLKKQAGVIPVRWQLGHPAPEMVLQADVLVHLACECIHRSPGQGEKAEENSIDVVGTARLYSEWRAKRPGRPFIFMSSRAASPDSANQYGRIKHLCETAIPCAKIIRPGIIVADGGRGVYGLLKSMLMRFPAFPVPAAPQAKFYMVDVETLGGRIALLADNSNDTGVEELRETGPLTFPEMLRNICKKEGIAPPLFVPIPMPLMVAPLRLAARLHPRFFMLKERVVGLLN